MIIATNRIQQLETELHTRTQVLHDKRRQLAGAEAFFKRSRNDADGSHVSRLANEVRLAELAIEGVKEELERTQQPRAIQISAPRRDLIRERELIEQQRGYRNAEHQKQVDAAAKQSGYRDPKHIEQHVRNIFGNSERSRRKADELDAKRIAHIDAQLAELDRRAVSTAGCGLMPPAFPVMCLANMKLIEAAATQRAQGSSVPFDEALASMPREELIQASLEGMPAPVRKAFLNGERTAATYRERERRRPQSETNEEPLMALGTEAMNTQNGTTLSPAEYTAAQRTVAQMAAPLTVEQLDVCAKLGVTPEAYKLARDNELSEALPGGAHGLTDGEQEVCQALGMSESAYAAEKQRVAAR